MGQEKSRQLGLSTDSHQGIQEQPFFSNLDVISGINRNRWSDSIPEIATEPICPEGNMAIGSGRGRGSGGRAHELNSGMKKARRVPSDVVYSFRERSATPEQDFSDAPVSPQKNANMQPSTTISR